MAELLGDGKEKKRVAIYIRVSTAEQKVDGYSLEAQQKRLMEYVAARNYEGYVTSPDWVFSDVHTGADLSREALDEVRERVKKKEFDAVLVWKIDRLSRSLKHLLIIFEEFEKSSVSFISVQENIDFRGPIGKLVFQIFGALAQFERELIKGRTQMGKIASAEMGNYTGSQIPYGYKPVPNPGGRGRKLQLVPEEKKWVEQIFNWYVYDDLGFREICNKLNRLGVPLGKYSRSRRVGKKWTEEIISTMVASTVYRGVHFANKRDENGGMLPIDKWTVTVVPPCVSEYLFMQAQVVRGRRKAANAKDNLYILSGKLRDMEFNRGFVGCKRTKGGISYRRKQFTSKDTGVFHPVFEIPALQMDSYVVQKIKEALKEPELFIKTYLAGKYSDKTKVQQIEDELALLRNSRGELDMSLERIENAYEKGTYSDEKLAVKTAEVNVEMARIDSVIQKAEDELRLISAVNLEAEKLREASKQVKFKLDNLTPNQQKVLVDLFVERVEMYRKKVDGKWKVTATVCFRFNPDKFGIDSGVVRTGKALPDEDGGDSKSKKRFNGPSQMGRTRKGHDEKLPEIFDNKNLFNGATDRD